jgi:hypothetical protein
MRVALLLGLLLPALALARCDPTADPDRSDIENARAAVAAHCDCGTLTHAAYVGCAETQAHLVLTNASCAKAIKRCASKSTCGRPGFVTCCRTTSAGRTSCAIKSGTAKCAAPRGGHACVGLVPSCCDACSQGGCATTTSTSTTTTMPACLPDGSRDVFCTDDRCCSGLCQQALCCVGGGCHNADTCESCIGRYQPGSECFIGGCRTDADCCTTGDVCVHACGFGQCSPSSCLGPGSPCCADAVCCNGGVCPASGLCP